MDKIKGKIKKGRKKCIVENDKLYTPCLSYAHVVKSLTAGQDT